MSPNFLEDAAKRAQRAALEAQKTEVAKQKPGVEPKLTARQKKSTEHVKKKAELAKKLRGDKEKLYAYWTNNNPKAKIESKEEPASATALREIVNPFDRKEVYMLLKLIEKYWNVGKARKLYKQCMVKEGGGYKFQMYKLRRFFSEKEAAGKLGVYYGTRTILFRHPNKANPFYRPANVLPIYAGGEKNKIKAFTGDNYTYGVIKVTGWWAKDIDAGDVLSTEDKREIKDFEGDAASRKLPKIDGVMTGKDHEEALKHMKGDKFVGRSYLFKSLPAIHKELYFKTAKGKNVDRDSGLGIEQEDEVKKTLKKFETEARGMSEFNSKREILTWFKKKEHNKWVELDKKILSHMCYIFGPTSGRYLYRYVPSQNRIFAISIDGAKTDPRFGKGSYIEVKNGKLEKWVGGKDGAAAEKMLQRELLGQMTPAEIKTEINKYKARLDKSPSKESLLAATKDRVAVVFRKYKSKFTNVQYSALQTKFYDKFEVLLKKDLIETSKCSADEAAKFAAARIKKIKEQVNAKLSKDNLKEFFDKNLDEVISINVISATAVSVGARAKTKFKKFKDGVSAAAKKLKEKGSDALSIAKEQYEKFMAKTGFFGKFLDKFFDFKKMITEYVKTGKKSLSLSIAGFLFGAEFSRRALKATVITSMKDIEKLAKENSGVTKDTMKFKDKFKLTGGYKIVIPKGKGINLRKKMKLNLKGVKDSVEADPAKAKIEKPKQAAGGLFGGMFSGLGSAFGRRGKRGNLFKDQEIIITGKHEIPAETYIPKGAKILKA